MPLLGAATSRLAVFISTMQSAAGVGKDIRARRLPKESSQSAAHASAGAFFHASFFPPAAHALVTAVVAGGRLVRGNAAPVRKLDEHGAYDAGRRFAATTRYERLYSDDRLQQLYQTNINYRILLRCCHCVLEAW